MSFITFYSAYYREEIKHQDQPLLEAYPCKDTETCFIIPELCKLTGFTDELRKEWKTYMPKMLETLKVSPQDRLNNITEKVKEIHTNGGSVFKDWDFTLQTAPNEVDARILDPPTIFFQTGGKEYETEDGSFMKWMRNGVQCPVELDNWLFIYPESDLTVIEIWLRSLKDIAWHAFGMIVSDPKQSICVTNQRHDLAKILKESIMPSTQLVLLLTPAKDC